MMNRYLYLFFAVLILSCGNNPVTPKSLVGEYSDKQISTLRKLYWMYILNEFVSCGNSLSLRSDSTYTYMSCGSIINGIWSIDSDSISLTCLNIRWRNDSINKIRPALECGKTAGKIYISQKGDLEDRFIVRKEDSPTNKDGYVITLLSKNE